MVKNDERQFESDIEAVTVGFFSEVTCGTITTEGKRLDFRECRHSGRRMR